MNVPQSLRHWFVAHAIIDVIFALPLFVVPVTTLELFGWTEIDPFATRLTAAALFGIGLESYFGRNASRDVFVAMLNLKVIWSFAATVGIALSLVTSPSAPFFAWVVLAIFGGFFFVWLSHRRKLA